MEHDTSRTGVGPVGSFVVLPPRFADRLSGHRLTGRELRRLADDFVSAVRRGEARVAYSVEQVQVPQAERFEAPEEVPAELPAVSLARVPERHRAAARMAAMLVHGRDRGPSKAQVVEATRWLAEPMTAIQATTRGTCRRTRSSAPVMLACAGRILAGDRDFALATWRSFVQPFRADRAGMEAITPAVGSILNQIDRGEVDARSDPWDLAARAWVMFDPKRAAVTRVRIRNRENNLAEIREVLLHAASQKGHTRSTN